MRDIAWKAQTRLTARYRALRRAGKPSSVAITAVARELAAFIWAVGRAVGLGGNATDVAEGQTNRPTPTNIVHGSGSEDTVGELLSDC